MNGKIRDYLEIREELREAYRAKPREWIDDKTYQLILFNMPIVCVDVAIVRDNKVLLVKRNNEPAKGEWWLPGGRLYKGEKLEQCATRKALEETNLKCLCGPLIHAQSTIFDTVHSVNFCYLLFPYGDNVILDHTSTDYKWYHFDRGLKDFEGYVGNCLRKIIQSDL